MSDWINRETEKILGEEGKRNQKEYLINFSKYWGELRSQIEKDIAELNNHARWKVILETHPLKVFGNNGNLHIKNDFMPSINIYLTNEGEEIKFEYKISESERTLEKQEEIFKVEYEKGRIYLKGRESSYLVPEEASEYILKPIFKMLKMVFDLTTR